MDSIEARELLGEEFEQLSDETVETLVALIKSVCEYVISSDSDSTTE